MVKKSITPLGGNRQILKNLKKGKYMLVEVNDKKVREYLKSMYLDFKLSPIKNEESELLKIH